MHTTKNPGNDTDIGEAWLSVPQAVYLEATRDPLSAIDMTHDNPEALIVKVARRLSWLYVPDGTGLGRLEAKQVALHNLRPARGRYDTALHKLNAKLVAALPIKGRRQPGLPLELIDPAEFTGLQLVGFNAVNPATKEAVWFDLRVNAQEQLERLVQETPFEPWNVAGDPLPPLLEWAASICGGDLEKLPGRVELLRRFRGKHGQIRGINQHVMREVRRRLASGKAKRGGSPMHRR